MKRECNTCVYKEGSCYPSTTIFDKDKTCKSYVPDYEGYIVELEKKNAELKAFRQDCVKLTEDNVVMARQRAEIARKLLKAKELLKIGLEGIKREFLFDGNGNRPFAQEAINLCNLFCEKVEQFLKEVSE